MKESIEKRIGLIKSAETPEELRKCLCPFYEKGGHPDCITCRKTEADLEECRDYYLDRITLVPQDLWSEEFDKFIVREREQIPVEEVSGIGINCDNCYMYDKCPLYKKGYACGIKWDNEQPKSQVEFIDFLIRTQYERIKRSSVFEKIDGGVPDAGLSGEMDRLTDYLSIKDNMGRERLSISVEASGPSHQSGGILSKLFGGDKAIPEKPESVKEAESADYEIIDEA